MAYDGLLSMNNPMNQTATQVGGQYFDDHPLGLTLGTPTDGNPLGIQGYNPTAATSTGGGAGGLVNPNGGLGTAGAAWGLGLGTLQAGFGLYSGLKQLSLANKEFKLNKAIATQNMNNEVKQYNTNLQTTAGLRSSMEGTGGPNSQAANNFYNNNKLTGV